MNQVCCSDELEEHVASIYNGYLWLLVAYLPGLILIFFTKVNLFSPSLPPAKQPDIALRCKLLDWPIKFVDLYLSDHARPVSRSEPIRRRQQPHPPGE